jgi:hypothetical protein
MHIKEEVREVVYMQVLHNLLLIHASRAAGSILLSTSN